MFSIYETQSGRQIIGPNLTSLEQGRRKKGSFRSPGDQRVGAIPLIPTLIKKLEKESEKLTEAVYRAKELAEDL